MAEAQVVAARRSGDITSFFPPSPSREKQIKDLCKTIENTADLHLSPSKDKNETNLNDAIPTPDSTPTKDTDESKSENLPNIKIKISLNKKNEFENKGSESPKPTQPKLSKSEPSKPPKKNGRRKGKGTTKQTTTLEIQDSKTETSRPSQPKAQPQRNTKKNKAPLQNHLVTEYFPVRRSCRRTKSDVEKDKQRELEEAILSKRVDGLKVEMIEGKGRGVVSSRPFARGEFIVEYEGDLVDLGTARGRERNYEADPELGCYMYYFTFQNKNYCVDATAESGRLGRLLNHSRLKPNCKTQVVGIDGHPYLILVAARDIKTNEELTYDYGDRSKASLEAHPWLAT